MYMYMFLHVFDKKYFDLVVCIFTLSKNRSVDLSLKRSRDQPLRPAHSVVEKFYTFPPIREKQVFSYLRSNIHQVLVNCLCKARTVWLSN